MTKLCKRLNESNGKEIPSYGCGQMDKCKLCFAHSKMKALCGMFINSWAILGKAQPTFVYLKIPSATLDGSFWSSTLGK
jgi:hypothetical protein